jgi:hypothetical protein
VVPPLGRPAVAAALAAALALGGCTPWPQRLLDDYRAMPLRAATEPPVACGPGPFPSRPLRSDRRTTMRIGSLAFRGLAERYPPERFERGAPPLIIRVSVPPDARAIVAVPPSMRMVAGLEGYPASATTPWGAHRAVFCETGPEPVEYRIAFVVAGARCVPVSVTLDAVTTTRNVPFGVSRCPG